MWTRQKWITWRTCWLTLVVIGIAAGPARGEKRGAGSPKPGVLTLEQSVQLLLMKDCSVGDSIPELAIPRIRSLGPGAVPVLWDALRHGPTRAELERLREDARRDYQAIVAQRTSRNRGDPPITQQAYIRMQVGGFDIAYRERALNALLTIRPSGLRDSLESLGSSGMPAKLQQRLKLELKR